MILYYETDDMNAFKYRCESNQYQQILINIKLLKSIPSYGLTKFNHQQPTYRTNAPNLNQPLILFQFSP